MSDHPYDSAQPHQLQSIGSNESNPAVPEVEHDGQAVRAAVLGPTSLMPAIELPSARPAAPGRRLLWVALVVLVAMAITVAVVVTG